MYSVFRFRILTEKETLKGKMKNPKVQESKRCENVKSNNRIIHKIKKLKNIAGHPSNYLNYMNENNIICLHILFSNTA